MRMGEGTGTGGVKRRLCKEWSDAKRIWRSGRGVMKWYQRRKAWRKARDWQRLRPAGKRVHLAKESLLTLLVMGCMLASLAFAVWAPWIEMRSVATYSFEDSDVMSEYSAWAAEDRLVVTADAGGLMFPRLDYIDNLRRRNVAVEVHHYCLSACTFYLMLPNTCTYPDSLWVFHSSRNDDNNTGPRGFWWKYQDWMKMSGHRQPFRSWLRKTMWSWTFDDVMLLTGKEILDSGWVKPCTAPQGPPPPGDKPKNIDKIMAERPNPLADIKR